MLFTMPSWKQVNSPYKFKWTEKTIPVAEGIDNHIYFTVDAFPNAYEMWKEIERLKQGESINFLLQLQPECQRFVTLVKQSQELKIVSYHKLYDILKQHQNEVNEIRDERLARTANPLALVAQQQSVYHPQNHPNHNTQHSSTRSQQAATKNRGKAIVNSSTPSYDQEPAIVADDDERSKDKEIDKIMALIYLSFKKTTNLPTTTSKLHQTLVEQIRIIIQRLTEALARECQKPKWAKDVAYHKEKMLLCKQEEAVFQLNAEQADWRDDTDDKPDD
ncbi:hypothetical protein Tco_1363893 [Tanacetum coccineum]